MLASGSGNLCKWRVVSFMQKEPYETRVTINLLVTWQIHLIPVYSRAASMLLQRLEQCSESYCRQNGQNTEFIGPLPSFWCLCCVLAASVLKTWFR